MVTDPLRDVLAAAVEESRRRGYKTVVVALDDLDELLAEGVSLTREPGLDVLVDIPSPKRYENDANGNWFTTDMEYGWDCAIAAVRAALASEDRP